MIAGRRSRRGAVERIGLHLGQPRSSAGPYDSCVSETSQLSERTTAIWIALAWLALTALIVVPALIWGSGKADGPYGSATPFVQALVPLILALIAFARAKWGEARLPAWIPRMRYALHAVLVGGLILALVFYAWLGVTRII